MKLSRLEMVSGHCPIWNALRLAAGRSFLFLLIILLAFPAFVWLTASPAEAQPSISSFPAPLPEGRVGFGYSATVRVAGGTAPYTWGAASGLPPGIGFTHGGDTGTISGIPTTQGTYAFSITVTDSASASATFNSAIIIAAPALNFTTIDLPQGMEGESYSGRLSATGGTPPYIFTITSGDLPPGLTLRETTGTISGRLNRGTAGTSSLTVTVTDSSTPALSVQRSFSIFVEKGTYEPVITVSPGLKAGQTQVFVGGVPIAVLRGGESITLKLDLGVTRVISVEPVVQHPTESGVRFRADSDRITVTELSPLADFSYTTEYLIDLRSRPPEVGRLAGSNWYKEGYTLRSAAPAEVEDRPGTQYRFSHWVLPTGETVANRDLSLTVNAPGSVTANYDTYYLLTLTSPYGKSEGSAWYKAGSEARWSMVVAEVPMSGILGTFGGKLKATNRGGTQLMDGPRTIAINWEPDYTLPVILIPLAILLPILAGWGLYLLLRGSRPKPAPAPAPMPYQPMPLPQPNVIVIGGEPHLSGPQLTRKQLLQRFDELLQKYEQEIMGPQGRPDIGTAPEDNRLTGGASPAVAALGMAQADADHMCSFARKRLLRTVVSSWRQMKTRAAAQQAAGQEAGESVTTYVTTWARDIFQEWEIFSCSLSHGHEESHEGILRTAYSLLNTVTEETARSPGEKAAPPAPHFTDGLPHAEIPPDQVIAPDKLPPENVG